LKELQESDHPVVEKLSVAHARTLDLPKVAMDEKQFRWSHNEDAMATEKLAEGIRAFAADQVGCMHVSAYTATRTCLAHRNLP